MCTTETASAATSDAVVPSTSATNNQSALTLLAALGVRFVSEGLALGFSDTLIDSALLSVSIGLHQPAESLAILIAFLKSGISKKKFTSFGPIGFGIGAITNAFAPPIIDCLVVAIVAGPFVYVGATEDIPEEWETPDHKWTKFAALMGGMSLVQTLTLITHSFSH